MFPTRALSLAQRPVSISENSDHLLSAEYPGEIETAPYHLVRLSHLSNFLLLSQQRFLVISLVRVGGSMFYHPAEQYINAQACIIRSQDSSIRLPPDVNGNPELCVTEK